MSAWRADGAQETQPAAKDLPGVRASVHVAEEMGRDLGRGPILLGRMPNRAANRGGGEAIQERGLNSAAEPIIHPPPATHTLVVPALRPVRLEA